MKIGIDACCWSNQRGYGRFTREILKAFCKINKTHELIFLMDAPTASVFDLTGDFKKIVVKTSRGVNESAGAGSYRSPGDLLEMTRALLKVTVDCFYFPSVYTYFPVLNRCKRAVTIHDTIAERFPEFVLPSARDRWFWKAKVFVASRQADLVLTVSEFAKNSIVETLKIPSEKIRVLMEAPQDVFYQSPETADGNQVLNRFGLHKDQPFFLYLGGISPHKNLKGLIEAFDDNSFAKCKLVVVGEYQQDPFYSDRDNVQRLIMEGGLNNRIVLTGFLRDEDLLVLFKKTLGLVLPSFYEGFGLPAIEAMAAGAPVIVTKSSAIPEIAPDGALFVDPMDSASIRSAMLRLLKDPLLRQQLSRTGNDAARRLSWEASAQRLMDALAVMAPERMN